MTRAVPFALIVVCVLAFAMREAGAPGHRHAPAPGDAAPEWLIDDPDAAYHLRRVELALAAGRVPDFDRFLNHPRGSPVPWPPFADGALAVVGRILARSDPADPADRALGGHSEARLESVLVHVPPVLGVLVVLAVFAATLGLIAPGPGRAWAALLAALVYATSPAAVWYGEVTRIDHHVLVALLLALELAFMTWALRAKEPVDTISGALVAGLVAGIALLTWLAAGVFVGIAGIALFVSASNAEAERARLSARAGVLFFAAAAATTMIPASASAWNAVQPGSLVNLTEAVPRALLCAGIPFVVAAILTRPGRSRVVVVLAALAALIAVLFLLPGFFEGVGDGFAWASRDNLFMDVVGESRPLSDAGSIASWLGWPVFVFLPAWLFLAVTSYKRPERVLLVLLAAVTFVMALAQRRFGSDFAVPGACTIGVAVADGLARTRRLASVARGAFLLAALGSMVSVYSLARVDPAEYRELALWRAEVLRGLRWMRTSTPPPGPWNAPEHPQDYCVLTHWGMGHLVEYHARRPSAATNFGSFVGEAGFSRAAAALLETDPERFVARMHALDAQYVAVTPRHASDLVSLARIAHEPPSELFVRTPDGRKAFGPRATKAAILQLAFHDQPVGSQHYPGLELVYAAHRLESETGAPPRSGEPRGPVISIYRLLDLEGEPESPVIEAGE